MRILAPLCLAVLGISCERFPKKHVFLVKQWHLSPSSITTDIEASKSLPQYTNQLDTYLSVAKMVKAGKTQLIIAQGCQGEVKKGFKKVFNGWSLESLSKQRHRPDFHEIMAPVPMKLKARFPKLTVLCGDHDELIEENLKAMSDLRAFADFYFQFLKYQHSDAEKFKVFSRQLKKMSSQEKISSPIDYSLKMALSSLRLFERMIIERNQYFFSLAKKNVEKSPVIIIGGLHIHNLQERFKKAALITRLITPAGYSQGEDQLIEKLRAKLVEHGRALTQYRQVPSGFNIKQFATENLLSQKDLFTAKEFAWVESLIRDKAMTSLLLSDYDNDGVRDFTFSQNRELLEINAEDPDWDNDGIPNLIDPTLGENVIGKIGPKRVDNHFFSTADVQKLQKELSRSLTLISIDDVGHELIVLQVYRNLVSMFKDQAYKVKYLIAKNPRFSREGNVFFSYIPHIEALEYNPQKLHHYLNQQYKKNFKGAEYHKFIKSFVVPFLVYSLGSELAHALDRDEFAFAKKAGWSWHEKKYRGRYLAFARVESQKVRIQRKKIKYQRKVYKDWLKHYDAFYKKRPKDLIKLTKSSSHKFSFLRKHKLPSLYALSKPEEWFAQMYSMCLYQRVYPESLHWKRSIELEYLLGINPGAVGKDFCSHFL